MKCCRLDAGEVAALADILDRAVAPQVPWQVGTAAGCFRPCDFRSAFSVRNLPLKSALVDLASEFVQHCTGNSSPRCNPYAKTRSSRASAMLA